MPWANFLLIHLFLSLHPSTEVQFPALAIVWLNSSYSYTIWRKVCGHLTIASICAHSKTITKFFHINLGKVFMDLNFCKGALSNCQKHCKILMLLHTNPFFFLQHHGKLQSLWQAHIRLWCDEVSTKFCPYSIYRLKTFLTFRPNLHSSRNPVTHQE